MAGYNRTPHMFPNLATDLEEESDLFTLLTAIRVVNSEMSKIAQSPEQRRGTREVVNQLVDLALELSMGETATLTNEELPY